MAQIKGATVSDADRVSPAKWEPGHGRGYAG